ncbi:MAG: 50S ribosomal protein L5 [Candidatus Sungbacteria bacterium]|uniref:Large ribosomal subunit protein uL5 n=1 Tax=Candidatus Sungiibacteriota bacterium TaxID=2750080 RepID=A0A932VPP0_9BACT|nr:50S ribosomal protein L5 [Candidatus Sungbacteria bacterium]
MISLQEKYQKEVIPAMRGQFGYPNVMAVPRIEKVVVNVGIGRIRDEKERAEIAKYVGLITGQKPEVRPARKAIASFKTRAGLVIGYRVSLRGSRMYDFLARLIHVALPRTRDFKGLGEGSLDQSGNLTVGVKEHIVFPEIVGEDYRFLFGLEVTVVTSAHTRQEGLALLKLMGFPLRSETDSESGAAKRRR